MPEISEDLTHPRHDIRRKGTAPPHWPPPYAGIYNVSRKAPVLLPFSYADPPFQVDFSTLPTATIFDYLERNKALPPFGTQFIRNPFDPDARACDRMSPHKFLHIRSNISRRSTKTLLLSDDRRTRRPASADAASSWNAAAGCGRGVGRAYAVWTWYWYWTGRAGAEGGEEAV